MALSKYHQKYADQSNIEVEKKAFAKEKELNEIFKIFSLKTDSNSVRIAVLGCGDKRFITQHKRIFEKILKRKVEIFTFDIVLEHLEGEQNIFKHDCILPLPNPPYDITYGHVLLKFIEPEKQFDLLRNSYEALKPGGIAIHILDNEEVKATETKLPNDLWRVSLEKLEGKLLISGIKYKKLDLKYGPALVLIKEKEVVPIRAAAIIINNGLILLMHRFINGREYYVLPGGGVDKGEDVEESLIREIKEETGFTAKLDKKLWEFYNDVDNRINNFFLVGEFYGEMQLGGLENKINSPKDSYHLEWHKLSEISKLPLKPEIVINKILKEFI